MNEPDILPIDLQHLFHLFSSLPDVRFPELDPGSLHDAVARAKERQLELTTLEAQRDALKAVLEEEQEVLLRKGHRLHAYLRVFAEHDEALATKLNALSLPRLRRTASVRPEEALREEGAAKKRGRPRKVPSTDALFLEEQPAMSATP